MATIGTLSVTIGAETKPLRDGIHRARKAVQGFERDALGGLKRSLTGLPGQLAAVGGAAGFGILIKSAMDTADSIAKTSDAIGIATDKLAGMHLAAKLTGASTEAIDTGLIKLQKRVSEAARGMGEASATFEMLNLDAKELINLAPDQQFLKVSEAIKGLGNQSMQTDAALKLFEEGGAKLLNTMNLSEEQFEAITAKARAYGTALSRVDAAKIEAANDALTLSGEAVKGVATRLSVELAPMIQATAEAFAEAAAANNGFKDEIIWGLDLVVSAVGVVADAIWGWKLIFKSVETAGKVLAENVVRAFAAAAPKIEETINTIIKWNNRALELRYAITGEEQRYWESVEFAKDLSKYADDLGESAGEATRELYALSAAPPSEKIRAFYDGIKEAAEQAGQAIAATQQGIQQTAALASTTQMEALTVSGGGDAFEDQLAALDDYLTSEADKLQWAYQNRVAIATQAYDWGLYSDQEYYAAVEALASEHQRNLKDIEERGLNQLQVLWLSGWRGRLQIAADGLGNLSTLMNTQSREMFEVGKAAAIAETAVQTAVGAFEAYTSLAKFGPVGMAAGAALAATIAIKGANTIANISAQQFGSASVSASAGAAAGASLGNVPSEIPGRVSDPMGDRGQPQQAEQRVIKLDISGLDDDGIYSGRVIRRIAEGLNEAYADGVSDARVNIA